MQQLIASYLFQNKTCPLPGVGTLSVVATTSQADFLNKSISAPHPIISFINVETNPGGFIKYVSHTYNLSLQDAQKKIDAFCTEIKNTIATGIGFTIEKVGNFNSPQTGSVIFNQHELPTAFWQPVQAERVVHPQAEHQILVGDKETTNIAMADYFTDIPPTKQNWWIWAIVLAALAISIIIIYFSASAFSSLFGNSIKI